MVRKGKRMAKKKKFVKKVVEPVVEVKEIEIPVKKSICLDADRTIKALTALKTKSMSAYDDSYNSGIDACIDKIKKICGK